MIKVASLFDGIGGTPLAARNSGAECVWSSEIEPFPIKVTKHHFPNMKHYGDITQINGAEVEPVDIIVGGSPCQDLSVAGKRKGMKHAEFGDEETTRSGLFMEQIRIVKEMRNATNKPRYMVWENVPGAFSSNNGEDFRAVLEETARVADPTVSIPRSVNGWANAGSILADGFTISWRTFDAQYWGVPQRRRRIYLVADFGGQSAPEILFESEGVSWDIAESRSKGQGIAEDAERGTSTPKLLKIRGGCDGGGKGPLVQDNVSATLSTLQDQTLFDFRPAVCYGISAYESNCMKSSNPHSGIYEADTSRTLDQNGGNPACNQGGIMVVGSYRKSRRAKAADDFETWVKDDKTNTINCFDVGDVRTTQAIVEKEPTLIEMTSTKNTIVEDGICPTLTARMGTGGNQVNAVCFGEGGYGGYIEGRASTLMASGDTLGGGSETLMCSGKKVRRLTPLECERLQGYPANWTNIPGASDSARYKALGNSFAVPNILFVIQGCIEIMRCEV